VRRSGHVVEEIRSRKLVSASEGVFLHDDTSPNDVRAPRRSLRARQGSRDMVVKRPGPTCRERHWRCLRDNGIGGAPGLVDTRRDPADPQQIKKGCGSTIARRFTRIDASRDHDPRNFILGPSCETRRKEDRRGDDPLCTRRSIRHTIRSPAAPIRHDLHRQAVENGVASIPICRV